MLLATISKIQCADNVDHVSICDSKLAFVCGKVPKILELDLYHTSPVLRHKWTERAYGIAATRNGIYVQLQEKVLLFSLDAQFSQDVCSFCPRREGFLWNESTESLFIRAVNGVLITDGNGTRRGWVEIKLSWGRGLAVHNNLIYVPSQNAIRVYSLEGKLVKFWRTEVEDIQDLCIYKESLVVLGDMIEIRNLDGKNCRTTQVPDVDPLSCTANANTLFVGGAGEIYCLK